MRYEIAVALAVEDQEAYAQYRAEMRPLLEAAGGGFRYDFLVSGVLQCEESPEINRVFVIGFPSREAKSAFFADPRYLEIRARLFEPAVKTVVLMAEYERAE